MGSGPPPRGSEGSTSVPVTGEGGGPLVEPRYGWFAGVLEGPVGDSGGLQAAADFIAGLGVVSCDLEIEGGRFSLMFDEDPIPGHALGVTQQNQLVEGLQKIVDAASNAAAIESTLRSTLVQSVDVIETLFFVRNGEIAPVSRRRGLEEKDRKHAPKEPGAAEGLLKSSLGSMDPKRGLALLVLLLIGSGLVAWRRGYFEMIGEVFFARGESEMVAQTGPFGDRLKIELKKKLGHYVCTVQRGPGYPQTADEVAAMISAAGTPEDRAAATAVGNGRMVGLVLLDDEKKVIASAKVSLASLLAEADAEVEVELRAKLGGEVIELVIDPYVKPSTGSKD